MIYVLIAITSLIASFLTFFSGFGLGTILLPVFAIYYPLPIAIALTASVHFLNNLFKLGLVFKNINWKIALKFGIPSLIAAFLGAWSLKYIEQIDVIIGSYFFNGNEFTITWPGLLIGLLIVLFALIELIPKLSEISFSEGLLVLGGLLSGFFGGFSGHQGSIRSAFLLRLKLEKAAFIATGVFIACLVDVIRISLYTSFSVLKSEQTNFKLLLLAVFFAWIGAFVGNKLFKKTSIQFFKWFVGIFMLAMGFLILFGVIK
ncbi:MAG: sulfite exporter TauE/SafE family protein [Bacteroidota bacterium]|nr:sulfite exporter TauE/SafE family protein [Bacteroidota bacterium]MDP3146086.1 sulfite exporter TauE/SafE family protein [Bacteroidota bacterium]